MKVWRMEDDDGFGLFASDLIPANNLEYPECWSPEVDFTEEEYEQLKEDINSFRFACPSLSMLLKMVDVQANDLMNIGFHLVCYEVENAVISKSGEQLFYKAECAVRS